MTSKTLCSVNPDHAQLLPKHVCAGSLACKYTDCVANEAACWATFETSEQMCMHIHSAPIAPPPPPSPKLLMQ
eukprot:1161441-Pelagomonas_calceolata.AAC.3